MKKTYVLDTNVLLSDPDAINAFQENDVIIPMAVLEELDKHKSRPDEVGRNARCVNRMLDDMRSETQDNLLNGVLLRGGGRLRVAAIDQKYVSASLPVELQQTKVDNLIIAFMLNLASKTSGQEPPVLVSRDINVRVKCDVLGIRCEDYLNLRATDSRDFYTGVEVLEIDDDLISTFYDDGRLELSERVVGPSLKLYPNQIVVIKSVVGGKTLRSAVTKLPAPCTHLVPVTKSENVFGIKPRNKEQNFAFDLLLDPEIKLLTLSGPAGTGKTLLSLAAALAQLRNTGGADARYEKLIVSRPVQPIGKEIGFLPGTLTEKLEPWIAPIRDNLNSLVDGRSSHATQGRRRRPVALEYGKPVSDDGSYLSFMQDQGLIEIDAITFIRGRSIPNAFILVDESQNLSMHELKTIITRAGEGTKIVLTGDIEQIDNVHVDAYTNGLTVAIERFKDQQLAGHVTLLKGERSALATLASKVL